MQFDDDLEIWRFAKNNQFTIITQDSDFYDLSIFYGPPPKVIWIKTGNTGTRKLTAILSNKIGDIRQFLENEKDACLEIEG
jgi:predicted nuclease of predicted toxin-antitoxin system